MVAKASIPFTQYCLPDGRRKQTTIDVSNETADKAQEVIAYGWCFEVEILSTGRVSLTVEAEEENQAIEITRSGSDADEAVIRLVNCAFKKMQAEKTKTGDTDYNDKTGI